jgi:hypothetical protein
MKKLVLLLGISAVLLSCKSTSIAVFQTGSSFKSALIVNKPPDSATAIKDLTTLNGYDFRKLSISPSTAYGVLAFFKRERGTGQGNTRLEIYLPLTGRLIKQFSNSDLWTILENNTSYDFPDMLKTFITFDIRWKDKNTAVFEVQPLRGIGSDLTPSNVSIVYKIPNDEVTQIEWYTRGSSSPISVPSHTEKTTYTTSINGGKLYIEGQEVSNMPGNIEEVDLSVLKE